MTSQRNYRATGNYTVTVDCILIASNNMDAKTHVFFNQLPEQRRNVRVYILMTSEITLPNDTCYSGKSGTEMSNCIYFRNPDLSTPRSHRNPIQMVNIVRKLQPTNKHIWGHQSWRQIINHFIESISIWSATKWNWNPSNKRIMCWPKFRSLLFVSDKKKRYRGGLTPLCISMDEESRTKSDSLFWCEICFIFIFGKCMLFTHLRVIRILMGKHYGFD